MVSRQIWGILPTSLPSILPQGFQIKSLIPMNTPKYSIAFSLDMRFAQLKVVFLVAANQTGSV